MFFVRDGSSSVLARGVNTSEGCPPAESDSKFVVANKHINFFIFSFLDFHMRAKITYLRGDALRSHHDGPPN